MEIEKFRSTEIQNYRNTEIQKYRSTEIQQLVNTEVTENKNSEVQKYRITKIQKYRRACKITKCDKTVPSQTTSYSFQRWDTLAQSFSIVSKKCLSGDQRQSLTHVNQVLAKIYWAVMDFIFVLLFTVGINENKCNFGHIVILLCNKNH